ncbi:hypothetical protein [Balneola vulgaris]|uniref:hypothetical protein n=1 Tax=Balneola vulgaris TaxID=287535 RepID=UPI000360AC0F|nr:hypothetical protein [Balneola vulgaris]
MEYDLLFTVIEQNTWKARTSEGRFAPELEEGTNQIECIAENQLSDYVNSDKFEGKELTLVVIDPLRIQESIKAGKKDSWNMVFIHGSIALDAIIDRIKIGRDDNGKFALNVRHYD